MDLSEAEKEQYEQELEDTSIAALLIEQNALLHDIRSLLLQANGGASEPSEDVTQYRCVKCNVQVPESERQDHAVREHNALPSMDVSQLFEEV